MNIFNPSVNVSTSPKKPITFGEVPSLNLPKSLIVIMKIFSVSFVGICDKLHVSVNDVSKNLNPFFTGDQRK